MAYADSAPIEAGPRVSRDDARACANFGLKHAVVLLFLFLAVVSDIFAGGVLAGFGDKAVRGREPTPWGVVIQGFALVAGYAVASRLIGAGVI